MTGYQKSKCSSQLAAQKVQKLASNTEYEIIRDRQKEILTDRHAQTNFLKWQIR